MGFLSRVNASAEKAPIVKIEPDNRTRLRIIPLPGTKYEFAERIWQHRPPEEQRELFGNYATIRCTGKRTGCIFHDGEFEWKSSMQIAINVIEYELDKRTGQPTGNKDIKLWLIGKRIFDNLDSAQKLAGLEDLSYVDIMVARKGSKTDTVYTTQFVPTVLDPQISWGDFQPTVEAYRDASNPYIIDYEKLFGFIPMTSEDQMKWIEERLEAGTRNAEKNSEQSLGAAPTSLYGAQSMPGLPPLPGTAQATDFAAFASRPAPWPEKGTFGHLTEVELEWIVTNGTPTFQLDDVVAAKALLQQLNQPAAPPTPPAPPAPPVAPPTPPLAPAPLPKAAPKAAPAPAPLPELPKAPLVSPEIQKLSKKLSAREPFKTKAALEALCAKIGIEMIGKADASHIAYIEQLLACDDDTIAGWLAA